MPIIGIIVGVVIVIVGFSVQSVNISYFYSSPGSTVGKNIKFGTDFYTEMYGVTREVGYAVKEANNQISRLGDLMEDAIRAICNAIGWLIVSLGAIDIIFFTYTLVKSLDVAEHSNINIIDKNVQATVTPIADETAAKAKREANDKAKQEIEENAKREAEKKAKRDAEERAKRETEEKAKFEAEERAKREAEERAKREAEERAKREAEERAKRDPEERAKREAEERAKREAEERAKREAEERAKREAEERKKRKAEEKEKLEAEERAKREAEERAKREANLSHTCKCGYRFHGEVCPNCGRELKDILLDK